MNDQKVYKFVHENGRGSSVREDEPMDIDSNTELASLVTLDEFLARKDSVARDKPAATESRNDANQDLENEDVKPEGTAKSVVPRGPRGDYRQYNSSQITKLIDLVQETHMSAAAAGRACGITERTAQRLIQKWRESGCNEIPIDYEEGKRRGWKPILKEEHSEFLIDYIEEHPLAVVDETMEALCSRFEDLKISKTALQDHIVNECALSFKRVKKLLEKRNSEEILRKRKQWVADLNGTDVDFFTNCVFIDEASFQTHMIRCMG